MYTGGRKQPKTWWKVRSSRKAKVRPAKTLNVVRKDALEFGVVESVPSDRRLEK